MTIRMQSYICLFLVVLLMPTVVGAQGGNPSAVPVIATGSNPAVTEGTLAMGADGTLHTAYANVSTGAIFYGQCAANANCRNANNWGAVIIFVPAEGEYASPDDTYTQIELTPQGQPRISFAYGRFAPGLSRPDVEYYYAECDNSCLDQANWGTLQLPPLFLDEQGELGRASWFALTPSGQPRLVQSAVRQNPDPFSFDVLKATDYLFCNGGCLSINNWFTQPIDLVRGNVNSDGQAVFSLAITSDGRPIIAMYDGSLSPQPDASRPPQWGSNLVIYECTARCEQNNPVIQAGVITVAGGPWPDVNWRLVLDDNDVAYIVNGPFPWRSGSNVEEVLLGRCEDNCTQQNAWDFRLLLNTAPPGAIGGGLDITIDPRTQQPVVGFYSNDSNDPQQPNGAELVQHATCTANCNDDDFFERVFTLQTIYDTDSLAPPPPPEAQCISLGWGGTNPVSVAASNAGISLISNPSHLYACGASAGDFIDPITGELEEGFTGNLYTAFVPLASLVPSPDVNRDGIVSPADAIVVVNRARQVLTEQNALADIDGDNDIDQDDVNAVLQQLGRIID